MTIINVSNIKKTLINSDIEALIEMSDKIINDTKSNYFHSRKDEIFIGNAFDVIDTLRTYDMIVLGDVLEHFEKNQARQFFGKCIAHSNKHLIVCIPLGEKWTQEAIYGNPYERHLSFWSFEEFEPFISNYNIFHYPPGPYGAFLIKKEDFIDYKIKELRS